MLNKSVLWDQIKQQASWYSRLLQYLQVMSRAAAEISFMAAKEAVSWIFSAICEVLN